MIAKQRVSMKKIVFVLVLLVILAGFGWLVHRRIAEHREAARPGMRERSVAVETAMVGSETLIDAREFRGTLEAGSTVVVAPKTSGRLEQLMVDIGDEVSRSDLIAVLDGEEFLQQAVQAQAELNVGEASLEEAEGALAIATSDLRRVRELHGQGIASDASLEEKEARRQAAESRVKLAQAQVRQRQAHLRAAEVRLSYTRLYADWEQNRGDWRLVAERFADEGSLLRANEPVVSLVYTGVLRAVVYAIERDFPNITPGQTAIIRTDAYPGERFHGAVVRRAPVLEEGSRHARVEIEIDNSDRRLAPGMFARVQIRFEERRDVPVVPVAALARRNRKQGVFRVDDDSSTVRFIEVEPGLRSGGLVEVLSPELTGRVVTLGHHLLEDGSTVTMQEMPSPDEVGPLTPRTDQGGGAPGNGGGRQ